MANLNFELQGGLRYIDFCTGDFSIFPFPGMGTLIFFWFALVSNVNSHVAFCKLLIMMLRNKVSLKVKIQKKMNDSVLYRPTICQKFIIEKF